jgi:hypothetical protein
MLFKAGALADVIMRPTIALWPSSDLRHGPGPLGRRRRGEGGIYGEGFVHEALKNYQRSETTHTLSQGFVSCWLWTEFSG